MISFSRCPLEEVPQMEPYIPETMKAAAIDRYGGPDVLRLHELPVPRPGRQEVFIRLEAAGIGVWDADNRSGEFEFGKSGFPKVLATTPAER
jgi:NADPH2:quinone reductase